MKKSCLSKFNIGIIQGRLLPRETHKYQSFPFKNWKREFEYSSMIKIKKIEWVFDLKNYKKNPIFFSEGINSIKKCMSEYKVKIPSITVDYFMEKPFYKKKFFNNKRKIFRVLEKLFNNSKKIGVKYLVLPVLEKSSLSNKTEEKILINEIKKFLPLLKKNNQMILFETDLKPSKTYDFINKFDKKYFGINYDSGNSAGLNYNLNIEKKYFKSVKNVHLKDKLVNGPSVSLGQGKADLTKLFKILNKLNYKGNYILQTARAAKDQKKEILKNVRYLKNIKIK